MKKIVVAGAGGFIGGHLVKALVKAGNNVRAVDLKPLNEWYQISSDADNLVLDLRLRENCYQAVNGFNEVFNLAADMGGMGFIENNKAACMLSVLINTHLLIASRDCGIDRFFYASSACVYNGDKQTDPANPGLKESDAYPALAEDGYGWEKQEWQDSTMSMGLPGHLTVVGKRHLQLSAVKLLKPELPGRKRL
jgi:GDP-D-mannose 3',5'-epimerase